MYHVSIMTHFINPTKKHSIFGGLYAEIYIEGFFFLCIWKYKNTNLKYFRYFANFKTTSAQRNGNNVRIVLKISKYILYIK